MLYVAKFEEAVYVLAYSYDDHRLILELITVGSHEDFYRDIKRIF